MPLPQRDEHGPVAISVAPKDFLRVADLSPERLEQLLSLAAAWSKRRGLARRAARALGRALLREAVDTDARLVRGAAAYRLGLIPLVLRPDELQLGRGEPVADTARVALRLRGAIVVRTFAQRELDELAGPPRVSRSSTRSPTSTTRARRSPTC